MNIFKRKIKKVLTQKEKDLKSLYEFLNYGLAILFKEELVSYLNNYLDYKELANFLDISELKIKNYLEFGVEVPFSVICKILIYIDNENKNTSI